MAQSGTEEQHLYLSQAFLSLLSNLAFHFFIYGLNNLIMFILPSTTETFKDEWFLENSEQSQLKMVHLMYVVFHIQTVCSDLHRACSRPSLSLMESCKWDTVWIRTPSRTLSRSGLSLWRSHHREHNSCWLTHNTTHNCYNDCGRITLTAQSHSIT